MKKLGFTKDRYLDVRKNEMGEYIAPPFIARRLYQYNPLLVIKTKMYHYIRGNLRITEYEGFVAKKKAMASRR